MAKHYYDQGVSTGLGHHGNSDYQNFYGVQAIELVSGYEAANPAPDGVSRMEVNMKKLGLDERLLEQNGLNLGEGSPYASPTSIPAPRRRRCTTSTTPRAHTSMCPSPHSMRQRALACRCRSWMVATVRCTSRSAAR